MRETSDPFEQLERSHRRLAERLDELSAAAADLGGPHGHEARHAVEDVLDWIARAVTRHEQDEDQSLFPRLAGHAQVQASIAKLTAEHRAHEVLAKDLRAALDHPDQAKKIAAQLATAYRAHLDEEERVLFPAARPLLDDAARAAIVAEMDARRGR
jgi:iron-sulfur cluster repair protein YtfE (RIC family)